MTKIFILILILNGGGKAIHSVEFSSLATCQTALSTIKSNRNWNGYQIAVCVEK